MAKLPPHHRDAAFQDLGPLKSAMIHLTFDQDKKALAHRIGAIHINEDTGVETRFTVDILDAERRQAFVDGAGAHIQGKYVELCNEAFARRDNPKATPEQTGTPDRHARALSIAALGAWDTSVPKKPVFVLAQWAWKDAEGQTRKDGFVPERESTKTIAAQAPTDVDAADGATAPQGKGKGRKSSPAPDER